MKERMLEKAGCILLVICGRRHVGRTDGEHQLERRECKESDRDVEYLDEGLGGEEGVQRGSRSRENEIRE